MLRPYCPNNAYNDLMLKCPLLQRQNITVWLVYWKNKHIFATAVKVKMSICLHTKLAHILTFYWLHHGINLDRTGDLYIFYIVCDSFGLILYREIEIKYINKCVFCDFLPFKIRKKLTKMRTRNVFVVKKSTQNLFSDILIFVAQFDRKIAKTCFLWFS